MHTRAGSTTWLAPLLLITAACSSASRSSTTSAASTVPTSSTHTFPVEAFAQISDEPVSDEGAAELQAILDDMAGDGGMTATVLSPDGTWSGATGSADGNRDLGIDDQFFIASITKSVVATQVMLMVEAGELSLDDLASDHLPADLDFDTNDATIRQLLGQRSGIPDFFPLIFESLQTDRQHRWTTEEVLDVAGDVRSPAGSIFEYTDTNYVLLGQIIEQLTGRTIAQVLRDGALAVDGIDRLVYQPDEQPTEPMAMPDGESTALAVGGGYLPSIASVTAGGPAAAIASDAPSLARWWRALCSGEIVTRESLTEMSTLQRGPATGWVQTLDGYGLGMANVAEPYGTAIGHTGVDVGFAAWAGCLPESGSVVVVLSNRILDDIGGMARPLVEALSAD